MAPVRFLSVGDVEEFPDLAGVTDVGSVMLRWGHDKVARERPISQYLDLNGIKYVDRFKQNRVRESIEFLADRIGLDASLLSQRERGEDRR